MKAKRTPTRRRRPPTARMGWPQVVLAVAIAAIAAVPPTIIAWNGSAKVDKVIEKTEGLEKQVDGRMTEMLRLAREVAAAAGRADEKQAQAGREGVAAVEAARTKK